MDLELVRPDHLDNESWEAIEMHRDRLAAALRRDDFGSAIGNAKDLVESVARVTLVVRGVAVANNANMPKLLAEAHGALQRQAGPNLSVSPTVRDVASSALKIAMKLGDIRNEVGSGHGRPRVPEIREEMATIAVDATMLWCRWALRRLGHLLAGNVDVFITALRGGPGLAKLEKDFDALLLNEQPDDEQRRVGVTFGQRIAGGFGNAYRVGMSPAIDSDDLVAWPAEYRLGLVEGLMIRDDGRIGFSERAAEWIIGLLQPVPTAAVLKLLDKMSSEIATGAWYAGSRYYPTGDPSIVADAFEQKLPNVTSAVRPGVAKLIQSIRALSAVA